MQVSSPERLIEDMRVLLGRTLTAAELPEADLRAMIERAEAFIAEPRLLVNVETSNKAMRSAEAVSDCLSTVAGLAAEGYTSGPIADANGNTVGSWTAVIPADDEDNEGDEAPANLTCPHCRSRDRLEFDGSEWYCADCTEGQREDDPDHFVPATAVEGD